MMPITFLVVLFGLFCVGFAIKRDTGACQFDKYNKDHELPAVEKIRELIGHSYVAKSANGKWQYTVGICTNLDVQGGPSDAGAFQQAINEAGKLVATKRNIGSLKNVHLMAGHDWALLEYKDGESYNGHCGQEPKRTQILLSCDETADSDNPKMVHVEEERQKLSDCYYLFEMKHKSLCLKSTGSVLSVGSILLIAFFSVMGLYLLVGFIYQRFIIGSKGLEQIPNYEFWKDLGNLEADGCNLIFRTSGRQNTGFRGIGDEQLESADDIRDDNLLPM